MCVCVCVSVCVSPQMSYFPSIVFSDFLHGVGQSKMIKNSEARFSKKDLVFPKFWKKCQKVVKIEVFSIFLKNGSNDFPDFLCDDRSNPFLPSNQNRMSRKNLVLEIIGPKPRAGQVIMPLGPLFKREYLPNKESKSKSVWIFRKSKESTFEMPPVRFRISPLLHPENRARKPASKTLEIW